ncbi:DUF6053 domain-containing protein [Lysobacter enzymogenes]|uniref:DUF6053 domain-containing protein n=1 Tax=Lysobacter enzymogenes TaxID=69 RepID=UPI003D18A063
MGGASAPTLSAQVASLLRCGRSESVGPEGPPTSAAGPCLSSVGYGAQSRRQSSPNAARRPS